MITLVEALNYRCFKYIRVPLDQFHVLVGANGSGKSTFFDIISMAGDIMTMGVARACNKRSSNPMDLVHCREGDGFQIAIEEILPDSSSLRCEEKYNRIRYEYEINTSKDALSMITAFRVLLVFEENQEAVGINAREIPDSILSYDDNSRMVLEQFADNSGEAFINEGTDDEPECIVDTQDIDSIRAISHSPVVDILKWRMPHSNLLPEEVLHAIYEINLKPSKMRTASPFNQSDALNTDGSNFPWLIKKLKESHLEEYQSWMEHLQTCLPGLVDITLTEREDDRHCYAKFVYQNGNVVPSWLTSDGVLRLVALTLIAHLPNSKGTYFVEEPENGIHPQAIETVMQALSHAYDPQILVTSHSPIVLSMTELKHVLCFSKDDSGVVSVVRGDQHPRMQNWHHETSLGTLFGAGVLG